MSKAYPIFELIEEAHSHGRACVRLWDESKSLTQFLMQYNLIKEYSEYKNSQLHPQVAKSLKKKGYTVREIAKMLGYKHPGSITHLLKKKSK